MEIYAQFKLNVLTFPGYFQPFLGSINRYARNRISYVHGRTQNTRRKLLFIYVYTYI